MIALNIARPTVVFSQRAPCSSSTQYLIGVWKRRRGLSASAISTSATVVNRGASSSPSSKSGRRLGREVAAEHDVLAAARPPDVRPTA